LARFLAVIAASKSARGGVARQAEEAADNRPNGAMPALRAEVEHPSDVALKAKAGGDRLHLLDKSRLADPRFAAYSHDRAGRTLPGRRQSGATLRELGATADEQRSAPGARRFNPASRQI
jgi:hypothetical protein